MFPFIFLAFCVHSFHFYVEPGETKCFNEDLMEATTIVGKISINRGAFKVLIYNVNSGKYEEQTTATNRVQVYGSKSKHSLVDVIGNMQGKFQFTSGEEGDHHICVTPKANDWTNHAAKVYFDLHYGVEESDKPPNNAIESISAIKNRDKSSCGVG